MVTKRNMQNKQHRIGNRNTKMRKPDLAKKANQKTNYRQTKKYMIRTVGSKEIEKIITHRIIYFIVVYMFFGWMIIVDMLHV